jgi:hypothetical protein
MSQISPTNQRVSFRSINVNSSHNKDTTEFDNSEIIEERYQILNKLTKAKKNMIGIKALPISRIKNQIRALSPNNQEDADSSSHYSPSPKIKSIRSSQNVNITKVRESFNQKIPFSANKSRNEDLSSSLPAIKHKSSKFVTNNSSKTTVTASSGNSLISGLNMSNEILTNNSNEVPINVKYLDSVYEGLGTSKSSSKSNGVVKAYAANTYQGIVRDYNEDRVSIVLNIAKPDFFKGHWPRCCFFAIYDGHGGRGCAEFLRDNLHTYIIMDAKFPDSPKEALINGFEKAEEYYMKHIAVNKHGELEDASGSCAVVCLIVEDICYVANLGDSRAVCSYKSGKSSEAVTKDHKPQEEGENDRIYRRGGKIYQYLFI